MFRFLRCAAVVLVLPCVVSGQTTPPIAAGTTQKEVTRIFGAPKGRSATGRRESWLYENFQVVFEKGRVLRVVVLDEQHTENQPGVSAAAEPPTSPLQTEHLTRSPRSLPTRPEPATESTWLERVDLFSSWFWAKIGAVVFAAGTAIVVVRQRVRVRRLAEEARRRENEKVTGAKDPGVAAIARANALAHMAVAVPHPALARKSNGGTTSPVPDRQDTRNTPKRV